MKIAIIGPQGLPVPAVKGGAIETLIDVITKENENKKTLNIDIYTVFDKDALKESHKYYKVNIFFYVNIKGINLLGINLYLYLERFLR